MLGLSLRYQLGFALALLTLAGSVLVGTVAYRAAHATLEAEALRTVRAIAESRERAFVDVLRRQQQRAEAFVASVESLCGERAPSGALAFERECVAVALGNFHRAEGATGTELIYRGRRLASRGSWDRAGEFPPIGQLAHFSALGGRGEYTMQAFNGNLMVRARLPLGTVDTIFQDASGAGATGEAFLADRIGYVLTTPRYAVPYRHPVDMEPLKRCLAGAEGAMLSTDYRGVDVISGFRPISAIGGGCVIVNVAQIDALAATRGLGWIFFYASAALALITCWVAIFIAGLATRPINRLATSARAIAGGAFDYPVPIGGSSEVRHLSQALSTMAQSIGDLVRREQNARREAEAANRTKDEFLAMLSHELRTPLNAILGWASILGRGHHDPSRLSHAVRVIERNARAQSQMIDDLLDVSRVASGRQQLAFGDVSVAAAVDGALEAIKPAADAKGVELRKLIQVPDRLLYADGQRLQQILWNLLSNAVRFTPSGGRVEVIVRDVDGDTEIAVADTGIGIPPAFLPHVFERFRQADSSTTRAHGGLGLGLTIVRDLVELHGGTVRADSAGEGKGVTFTVRLPPRARGSADEETAARHNGHVALSGTRVLVVDDEPDAREVLRTILEDAGAVVTTTGSARETRAALRTLHPDLLIADIGMPEEDGYSLIRSIRTLEPGPSHMPAIALTAHARPQDVERAIESGFQIHMPKPVDSSLLVASIATLVHASES